MRITREDLQEYLYKMRRYGKIQCPTKIDKAINNNMDDIHKAFTGTNIKSVEI